jgi:signal transduction histidine kinase/CheY-like chemotaxis protein/HPt (histidine-containing phosphotransfer) domain-containing protein
VEIPEKKGVPPIKGMQILIFAPMAIEGCLICILTYESNRNLFLPILGFAAMSGLLQLWQARLGRDLREATDQREEQARNLQMALEGGSFKALTWDVATQVYHLDSGLGSFVGDAAREVKDLPSAEFLSRVHPDDLPRLNENRRQWLEGDTDMVRQEYRFWNDDRGWIWVNATAQVTARDGQGRALRLSGILREVTEAKAVEQELIKAKEAAEAGTRAKSTFLANMSHEIRTPMNAIIGMTHLALQTELTEKQKRYLVKTQSAALGLLGIINDILDLSKIEAGKLELEARAFSLGDVLDRITHLVGTQAAEKPIEFMLDTASDVPATLLGDPLRLGQILTNLCSNAVKFTESGEIIVSTCRQGRAEGERVTLRFCVLDTGIGMTPNQIEGLFLPFSQVDTSSSRKFGGTGLGLAISRHLVQMMGGELWATSEPGKGSAFTFTAVFGLGRPPQPEPVTRVAALSGLRVLIVDDSFMARRILTLLVERLGYVAEAVTSAAEGLEALKKAPFDLVLLDWRMPEVEGFEAARRIRRSPGLASAPRIILVTSYGDEEVARRVEQEGLAGHLSKPITLSHLFDAVRNAFGQGVAPEEPAGLPNGTIPESRARLKGSRVLLVEDNVFNQEVATELLTLVGVEVTVAPDGKEALEMVRSATFDAVLMDLQMPVMDGYEATRQLRADPTLASLPILAMTAHAMVQERERCQALGMNDYITKPIDSETLYATLARWVQVPGTAKPLLPTGGSSHPAGDGATPPAIDWVSGLAMFDGNTALYEKFLAKYLERFAKSGEDLGKALDQGRAEQAEHLAHTMIAAAGAIGAAPLSATALALQNAFHDGPREAVAPLLRQYESQFAQVIQALEDHVSPS